MADATITAEDAHGLAQIEGPTPLRDSLLWAFQRQYYKVQGVACWAESVVPNFVTSNAFLASTYAKVILGYIKDVYSSPDADRSQPVYILEVGSGHGKLAFLLLRELLEAWQQWPDLGKVDGDWAPCAAGLDSWGVGPDRRKAPFRMIISDFFEGNLPFWEHHESLQPYFDAGLLEIATFDAESDQSFRLRRSGAVIATPGHHAAESTTAAGPASAAQQLRNPLVAVANYIFDTLPQDAFRTVDGQLQQGYASIVSDNAHLQPSDPDAIKRVRVTWSYRPTTPQHAYPHEPHLQAVLSHYSSRLPNASLLIPLGGIQMMRNVTKMSKNGRVLVLAGDKSYVAEEELAVMRDPHVAVHGSFSFMVNFSAVRLWTLAHSGAGSAATAGPPPCFSLQTPYLDGFKCSAFVLETEQAPNATQKQQLLQGHDGHLTSPVGNRYSSRTSSADGQQLHDGQGLPLSHSTGAAGAASQVPPPLSGEALAEANATLLPPSALTSYPLFTYAWADVMDTFGPDNFSTLQRCARDEVAEPSLKLALSVVRMACWDTDVFFKFKQTVIDRTPTAPEKTQADVYRDVRRVYARYYPLQSSKDIAFELGRVCMGLRRYPEAIQLFVASQRQCGEHHVTAYNCGICLFHLGKFQASIACFDRSLQLKSDYQDAAAWRTRAVAKVEEEAAATAVQSSTALAGAGAQSAAQVVPSAQLSLQQPAADGTADAVPDAALVPAGRRGDDDLSPPPTPDRPTDSRKHVHI